jgi:50S ribosomal protein L16 3-hydroxylase
MSAFMQFAHFDVAAFLASNWQKRPLLIRNPWKGWANPLEPDELAGLACEEGVRSRLITHSGGKLALERGPLAEERFGAGQGAMDAVGSGRRSLRTRCGGPD